MATEYIFTDIDLDFGYHPFNRDVAKKHNEAAISRSIRNLVLTNRYERAFRPELGGSVRELLFEPADPVTANTLETKIRNLIISQEPRVKDVSVEIELSADDSTFECDVYFTPINTRTPTKITLYLKRVR